MRAGDDVLAAVDEDDLSLDYRRLRAGKEVDEPSVIVVGDVASAGVAGGLAREECVRLPSEKIPHCPRVQGAGRDAINAHAKRREFRREIARERLGKRLAGSYSPVGRDDLAAAAAGEEDYAASPLQERPRGLHEKDQRRSVEGYSFGERVGVRVENRSYKHLDRAMHHKIEPVDDRADLGQQGAGACGRADVRLD